MTDYLYKTLFTNYAFHKLANNLANDNTASYPYSPYNLVSVKVGNGDNTADLDKESLSQSLYELNITDIKSSESGTVTFICEIPEDLSDIEITEIGLFDKINGKDHLFSYSRVQLLKPADLGYKLVIELNLTLRTVNFYPNKVHVVILEHEMATMTEMLSIEKAFLTLETNLERAIDYNAEETGRYRSQVLYNNELVINNSLYGVIYASKYFNLLNKFGSNIINAFFVKKEDYLSYTLNDIATDSAYLSVYSNKIDSSGDAIMFTGESTLSVNCKLGEFKNNSPIVNKYNSNNEGYFRLYIDNSNLIFALGDIVVLSIELSSYDLGYLKDNYATYTLSFNGSWLNPLFSLYIDGVQRVSQVLSSLDPIEYIDIPLRNYNLGENTASNIPDVKSIIFLSKEMIGDEAYFLHILQKERND